jgi:hypothetical protein
MSDGKNIIETFRDVVQDLLVPELRAVKVSVASMREDLNYMRSDIGALGSDTGQSHEALREEKKLRHDNLEA